MAKEILILNLLKSDSHQQKKLNLTCYHPLHQDENLYFKFICLGNIFPFLVSEFPFSHIYKPQIISYHFSGTFFFFLIRTSVELTASFWQLN